LRANFKILKLFTRLFFDSKWSRASALLLLVLSSAVQAVGAERSPNYTGEGSQSCLVCHSGEKMRAVEASAHGGLELACEACHGPGSFHVSRAHGGRGFPRMNSFGRGENVSDRAVQLGACLACHGQGAELHDEIRWKGSVHDRNNINCSTCHQLHIESDPLRDMEQQKSTCLRCHRRHMAGHPRFKDKSIDFDALSCWTCHDVHNTMKSGDPATSGSGESP
jgi:hypothetical protein